MHIHRFVQSLNRTLSSPPPRSPQPLATTHALSASIDRCLLHTQSPGTMARSPTGSTPELTTLVPGSRPPAALPGQVRAQARTQDNRGGHWQELRHMSIHLSSSQGSDTHTDSGQPQPSRAASPGCVRGGTQAHERHRRRPGLVAATPACDARDGISSRASTSRQHTGPLQGSKSHRWKARVGSPSPAPEELGQKLRVPHPAQL